MRHEANACFASAFLHDVERHIRVIVNVVAARDSVAALFGDFLFEGNAQLIVEPVDGFAKMFSTELLHLGVKFVAAALHEILKQPRRIVFNAGRLLQGRACAVERANGQLA